MHLSWNYSYRFLQGIYMFFQSHLRFSPCYILFTFYTFHVSKIKLMNYFPVFLPKEINGRETSVKVSICAIKTKLQFSQF